MGDPQNNSVKQEITATFGQVETGALRHLVLQMGVPFKAGCACGVLLSRKLGGPFPLQGTSGFPWILFGPLRPGDIGEKNKTEKFNKIMRNK